MRQLVMVKRPKYQEAPIELREQVWAAGSFTPLQLFRVAAWKSARGLASLTLNTEQDITDRTSGALDAIRSWKGVDVLRQEVDWDDYRQSVATAMGVKGETGLLALSGFGYPMASAFLAILAPEAFPVIDKWTVKAVYGRDLTIGLQKAAVYTHFARRLIEVAPSFDRELSTVHAVDKAVMEAAMEWDRQDAGYQPLPFEPVAVPKS